MLSGASKPPANSLRKYSPHPCLWGEDQAHTLGHSKARARTQTPRFPHCTAALPWTRGQAHLLLLAISSLCLSIVSIKSRNWGQSQAEPVRAQSLLMPHCWQERRPTFTEAAGHQGAEPHPRRGWLPDREAQRGSPPTQLKSIRKEAASGLGTGFLERLQGSEGRKKATAWGLRELCPHSQGGARLCSQRQRCPYLLGLLFPEVPHLLAEHLGTGLTLPEDGLPVLVVVHGLLCWKPHRSDPSVH